MTKSEQIQRAIEDALNGQSKLGEATFDIGGFTSPAIRHLMNNLGAMSRVYMEIGLLHGSLHAAALYNNHHLEAVGIDNFSEFDGSSEQLIANLERYNLKSQFIMCDCFEVDPKVISAVDLYLYDGAHDYESQKRAITHFKDSMADQFILVVDDWSWDDVKNGTRDGIEAAGLKMLYSAELIGSEWHNGTGLFLLQK